MVFDTGWHTPGTISGSGFTNPDNMKVEDGNYANSSVTSPAYGDSIILKSNIFTNFGFNIPSGVIISEIRIRAKVYFENGRVGCGLFKPFAGIPYTNPGVQLYNGELIGEGHYYDDYASDTLSFIEINGGDGLFGVSLTPEIINGEGFGIKSQSYLYAKNYSYMIGEIMYTEPTTTTGYVDVVEMKVYYDYPYTTSIVETIDLNVVNDNYDAGAEISILDGMMNNNIRLIKVLGKNDVAENTCADLKKDALNAYLVPGVGVKDMTGLTNYYDFNETTGSTLYDLHGSNDGTVNGATMNQTGKLGTSYSFDGNDYVNLGSIALDNKTFSISMWFANTRTAGTSYIIGQGVGGNNTGLHIGREGTGKFRFAFFSNDLDSSSNVTTDGSWQHWVVTYNASTRARKIYLNGVLNASGTASTNYIGTGDLYIGYAPCLTEYMLGKGDEIALFVNKELSLAEVEQLYNSGAGLKYDNDTYAQEWVNNTNISGETTTTDNATDETIERITSSDEYATFLLSDITGDTKTTCQLYVQQVNNEPGCEIVYDLYSKDGEVDTDIPINELHEITNFEATTTKLNNGKIRIHLKNDALVPTSGYPSIKGYAIKFW